MGIVKTKIRTYVSLSVLVLLALLFFIDKSINTVVVFPSIPNVHLSGKCFEHTKTSHLAYMLITHETDTLYLENMKMHDNVVYVSEELSHCPVTGCCVVMKTGYDYATLDEKLRKVLPVMLDLFPSFITLSKIDDDTFIDHSLFTQLQSNFTQYSYHGRFNKADCGNNSMVEFAEGAFYTLGRSLINCIFENYRLCEGGERKILGLGFEDRAIALSINKNCKYYEQRDLNDFMNTHIFHKIYARKNKLLFLANKNRNAHILMQKYNKLE